MTLIYRNLLPSFDAYLIEKNRNYTIVPNVILIRFETTDPGLLKTFAQLNSTQLNSSLLKHGSRMAKKIQVNKNK